MNRTHTYSPARLRRLLTLLIACGCPLIVSGQIESVSNTQASNNDLLLTELPKTESARTVWRERASLSSMSPEDVQSRKRLQETLKRLKAIRFPDLAEPAVQTEPREPNEAVPGTSGQSSKDKKVVIVRTVLPQTTPEAPNNVPDPNSSLTKETTEALKVLAQSPETLQKPEFLGKILFQGQAWPQAKLCYEEALRRLNAKSVAPSEDKAWLLLQIGNCLQRTDPQEAMTIFKQLISEYPHSLWSEVVRVKGQWITWELRDKPKALISEVKAKTAQKGDE